MHSSFSSSSSSVSSVSAPTFPPTARTSNKATVIQQPTPTASMRMSVSDSERDDSNGSSVQRLRGGCVPCPDGGCCFIIPLPCCC